MKRCHLIMTDTVIVHYVIEHCLGYLFIFIGSFNFFEETFCLIFRFKDSRKHDVFMNGVCHIVRKPFLTAKHLDYDVSVHRT